MAGPASDRVSPPPASAGPDDGESVTAFASRWWEAQRDVFAEQAALALAEARLALFMVASALAAAVVAAGLVLSAWIFLMLGAAAGIREFVEVPGAGLLSVALVNALLAWFAWRALGGALRRLGQRVAERRPGAGESG